MDLNHKPFKFYSNISNFKELKKKKLNPFRTHYSLNCPHLNRSIIGPQKIRTRRKYRLPLTTHIPTDAMEKKKLKFPASNRNCIGHTIYSTVPKLPALRQTRRRWRPESVSSKYYSRLPLTLPPTGRCSPQHYHTPQPFCSLLSSVLGFYRSHGEAEKNEANQEPSLKQQLGCIALTQMELRASVSDHGSSPHRRLMI